MSFHRILIGVALCALLTLVALVSVYRTSTPATAAFPGGNGKIAFVGQSPSFADHIYSVEPDGSGLTDLTENPAIGDKHPAWSPDGTKIAFHSWRDGYADIYVMNADGSGAIRLTSNGDINDQTPSWSPDGSKIAFHSLRDGNLDIYVMNADGSGETRLTTSGGWDTNPSWSPDGSKIAFDTDRHVNWEIYVMNADGSNQTRLTNNATYDSWPDWSPDGSKIAFRRDGVNGFGDVYVMNADGSEQTRLTDDPMYDGQPAWSPDGSKIAFVSFRSLLSHDIYIMNADGSDQTRLTDTSGSEFAPNWQPLCEKECPKSTDEPEATPTQKPEEPTPTPDAKPADPEMRLNASGGNCDHPTTPELCYVAFGESFSLSVEVATAPEAGYVLAQTFIDYGGQLTYKPAASAADEMVWPDLSGATALRGEPGPGLVGHGGLTSLTPPMPVSHFEGTIVQLEMNCTVEASSTKVSLLAPGEKEAVAKGSLLVLPGSKQIVPALSGLTVECVAPEMVSQDTDGDGCADVREGGSDESMGGLRDYLDANDFYDVLGPGAALPIDGIIDLPNDILGVIQHFSPTGAAPYDVQFDRGPQIGANVWNMGPPDGVIDLPNDILGVIQQFGHDCT